MSLQYKQQTLIYINFLSTVLFLSQLLTKNFWSVVDFHFMFPEHLFGVHCFV